MMGASVKGSTLEYLLTVSMRKPSMPLSSQKRIAESYIALRQSLFSQLRSG